MADTAPAHRLSKSRYLAGLQCHKQLWWRVHEPDAPELVPDVALRNRFAQGADVDQRARGYVPGGELIDLPFYEYDNKVAATRDAIRHDPPVLYQPWFLADDTYAGVDILTRGPRGYDVIEVKAANHLKPECRHPDLSNLFQREDVTAAVEGVLVGLPDELAAQRRMLEGPLPDVAIGEHCTRPHDCPFLERCWPKLPDHHVSKLYRIERKQLLEYEADGYASMADLPTDLELSAIHARQVRAVRSGVMVVEPSLRAVLAKFSSPLAFLDFETVSLAIPRWPGCRPWQLVPVQFSCHAEERGRGLVHHEWIADAPDDPRPALAQALVEACAGARKVVAYYASFERDCIRHLKAAVPGLERELTRIEQRLVDLLPAIRNHVYHPDFGGSFSIKKTLPALVPGVSYGDLRIADGETATVELLRLMFEGTTMPPDERAALRRALLAYCARDSWAMVKMLETLRTLVAEQLELF